MKVLVKVIGPLMYKAGFSEKELEVPASTKIGDLIARIGIPADSPRIITRNGKAVLPEEEIAEGDKIAVSPIYSGG